MSLHALDLEDFGAAVTAADPAIPAMDPRESDRQAAWQDGFAAGRAAALAEAEGEAHAAAATAARAMRGRVEELGFSFQEARAHVMQSVAPMLRVILSQGLPQILHASLGARLEQEFAAMIEAHGDAPMALRLNASDRDRFAGAIAEGRGALPVTVATDDALNQGEIVLALGEVEREIDLDGFSTRLTEILDTLSQSNEVLLRHG